MQKTLSSLPRFTEEICDQILHWQQINVSAVTRCGRLVNVKRSVSNMFLQAALLIATGRSTGACKAELLELDRPEQ